jgi:phosphoketolase
VVVAGDDYGLLDAYWRAANYLSVGQIYLLANPLLREPLTPEHIKPGAHRHRPGAPAQVTRGARCRDGSTPRSAGGGLL